MESACNHTGPVVWQDKACSSSTAAYCSGATSSHHGVHPEQSRGDALGSYQDAVQFDGKCFNAIAVNYVAGGVLFNLCQWLTVMGREDFLELVDEWCMWAHGFDRQLCDCALEWAGAGWDGWPAAATPAACEPHCAGCEEEAPHYDVFHVKWGSEEI